jgi:hypothetical protein
VNVQSPLVTARAHRAWSLAMPGAELAIKIAAEAARIARMFEILSAGYLA